MSYQSHLAILNHPQCETQTPLSKQLSFFEHPLAYLKAKFKQTQQINDNNRESLNQKFAHFPDLTNSYKSLLRDFFINKQENASNISYQLTQFKKNYVLSIGELPLRMVVMSVSSGLLFGILNIKQPPFAGKLRNGIFCIVLNGLFWVPEIFNPMIGGKHKLQE